MSEILVIRLLGSTKATEASEINTQWLLVNTDGARLGTVMQGRLADAAGLSQGRKVVILVPSTNAVFLNPVLPTLKGKGSNKLAQIVPYAVEDQLAADIETLHFALGINRQSVTTPVIVVSRSAMNEWLACLTAVNIQPDALYIDTSLLPATQEGLSILIEQGRISLKQPEGLITTVDVSPLSEALQLLPLDMDQPTTLYIDEEEYNLVQDDLNSVRSQIPSIQLTLLPDGVLPLLALQTIQSEAINLLQGDFAQRKKSKPSINPWRIAVAASVGLLCMHLLTKGLELFQLSKQESALDQQIQVAFNQAQPGTQPVDPLKARHALETRWQQLQETGKPTHLMTSLDALSKVLANSKDAQVIEMNYQDNSVVLKILAPSGDSLQAIRNQVQSQGVMAEIKSTSPKDDKFEGSFIITPKTGA